MKTEINNIKTNIKNYLLAEKGFEKISYKNLFVKNGIVVKYTKTNSWIATLENINFNSELLKDIDEFYYIIEIKESSKYILLDKSDLIELFNLDNISNNNDISKIQIYLYYIPSIFEDANEYIILSKINKNNCIPAVLLNLIDVDCILSDLL